MTTLFLANVGNHDVQLADPSLLPHDLQDRWLSCRALGKILLDDFERYDHALRFPLIGVSLRWLLEREGVEPDELYVHLFASDQTPPPITPEEEREKDSLLFAGVVERYLKEPGLPYTVVVERDEQQHQEAHRLRLPNRQIHVHPIQGSPADYNNMLDYFSRELSTMTRWVDAEDRVYLEVTGGTPAMTSMLIVAGVDAFGRQARTLYVERGADRPFAVGIGRRFFARRARAVLREQLRLFAYGAARATLDREGDLIAPDVEAQALVDALLDYADRRLAFDIDRARDALHRARAFATGEQQARIQYRQRELQDRDTAALLPELIYSTRIKLELGHYADFTQRLFRFQEACFRDLAERMGLKYRGGGDLYADLDWVAGVSGLEQFLEDYVALDGHAYGKVCVESKWLNRVSLGAIVDFFVQHSEEWAGFETTVVDLHRLSRVARLRNKGLAGHGFEGIGQGDLREAFGDDPSQIIPFLEQIYSELFDANLERGPYESVNDLILNVLGE